MHIFTIPFENGASAIHCGKSSSSRISSLSRTTRFRMSSSCLGLLGALFAAGAHAQEAQPASETPPAADAATQQSAEIVVTGSRISRRSEEQTSELQSLM